MRIIESIKMKVDSFSDAASIVAGTFNIDCGLTIIITTNSINYGGTYRGACGTLSKKGSEISVFPRRSYVSVGVKRICA